MNSKKSKSGKGAKRSGNAAKKENGTAGKAKVALKPVQSPRAANKVVSRAVGVKQVSVKAAKRHKKEYIKAEEKRPEKELPKAAEPAAVSALEKERAHDNSAPAQPVSGKKTGKLTPEQEMEHYYRGIRKKIGGGKVLFAINTAAVSIVLGGFLCAFLFSEKQTYSENERRDLAQFPEFTGAGYFDGSFTRGIDDWFSDSFPGRESMRRLAAVVNNSRGIGSVKMVAPGPDQESQGITPPDSPVASDPAPVDDVSGAEVPPAVQTPHEPEDDGTPATVSNGIIIYKGRAMSAFGGRKDMGKWYADVINTYNRNQPDVQVYNMVIPTVSEFYTPKKYTSLTASQKEMIDYIYSELDGNIKKVDAYSKLQAHTDEYLYFNTDHHWTGLGAYYAYTAFCEQAGFTPIALDDCETRALPDFIGTMYGETYDPSLLENPDRVDYYIFPQEYTAEVYQKGAPYTPQRHTLWGEYAQGVNSYSVFLHGDFPLIKVKTGNQSGRKILVVKESFGNAFAPYLINHYDEVYIVDQRYFEVAMEDFIEKNGIHELIFVNNSFAACTPGHIRWIDGLRQGVAAQTPVFDEKPERDTISEDTSGADTASQAASAATSSRQTASVSTSAASSSAASSPATASGGQTPKSLPSKNTDSTSGTSYEEDGTEPTEQNNASSKPVYIISRPEAADSSASG